MADASGFCQQLLRCTQHLQKAEMKPHAPYLQVVFADMLVLTFVQARKEGAAVVIFNLAALQTKPKGASK